MSLSTPPVSWMLPESDIPLAIELRKSYNKSINCAFYIGLLALSLTEDVDQRLFWLKLAPPSFHLTAWHLLHLLDLKLWSGAVFSHEIAFPNILAGGCGQFADAIKGGSAILAAFIHKV